MTAEHLSIRETSGLLGVSQLRVRELIRKGKLVADKVVDAAGERWNIAADSAHTYLSQRPARDEAAPAPVPARAQSNGVVALVAGLEAQVAQLQAAVREIKRALEHEKAPTPPPATVVVAKPEPEPKPEPAPVVESSNGAKPAEKKKPKAAKPVKIEAADKTPLGAALKQAGVVESAPRTRTKKSK